MKGTVIEKLIGEDGSAVSSTEKCSAEGGEGEQAEEQQRHARIVQLREQGNACVKEHDYDKALQLYKLAIDLDSEREFAHLLYLCGPDINMIYRCGGRGTRGPGRPVSLGSRGGNLPSRHL